MNFLKKSCSLVGLIRKVKIKKGNHLMLLVFPLTKIFFNTA
jgi:hypothetical protein